MILIHHRQASAVHARPLRGPAADSGQFTPINPLYAALLRVLGPADCGDNPLSGTKYDAVLAGQRDRERFERRAARVVPRSQRRHHPLGVRISVPSSSDAAGATVRQPSGREETREEPSDTIP